MTLYEGLRSGYGLRHAETLDEPVAVAFVLAAGSAARRGLCFAAPPYEVEDRLDDICSQLDALEEEMRHGRLRTQRCADI